MTGVHGGGSRRGGLFLRDEKKGQEPPPLFISRVAGGKRLLGV